MSAKFIYDPMEARPHSRYKAVNKKLGHRASRHKENNLIQAELEAIQEDNEEDNKELKALWYEHMEDLDYREEEYEKDYYASFELEQFIKAYDNLDEGSDYFDHYDGGM